MLATRRRPWDCAASFLLALLLVASMLRPAVAVEPVGAVAPRGEEALEPLPTLVARRPCPGSRFECITLAVPRDHFAPGGPSWDVTFGIQRATKTAKGVFVTITGGPGTSGLASADSYTDAFDPSITDSFDIVFLDQRGVGLSEALQCPVATAVYYSSTARPQDPAQLEAAGRAAQTYVHDCLAEGKIDPSVLPFYSTRQAVEDLEAFRRYLGSDKLVLYGESYGTQYVQTYAAAHPDHVAGLIVDGPVDLAADGPTFNAEAARAFDDALTATLRDCATDRACAADLREAKATQAYDRLAGRLLERPIAFRFPTAQGTFVHRQFTIADLETAAAGYLYTPFSRMLLQRALTAAAGADYVPLARLAYDSLALDPETLAAKADPSYSDAMYYAVECQDYAYYPGGGDPFARLKAWADAGTDTGVNRLRLASTYYGDLPCLYWPAEPASDTRPAPLLDTPFPILVLTATLDPATPISNAMRIYARASDAYLVVTTGGPHIVFGRGEACPDQLVTAFVARGTLPATRVTVCDGLVADPYVRNALRSVSDYRDALALMASMDDQIVNTDDYNYLLGDVPIVLGCDFGGTLAYRPGESGTALLLRRCAFTRGVPLSGKGIIDPGGAMRLDVQLPGGSLHYVRDADGTRTVKGTYRTRRVNLRR
jgi:pimeloyl-ACP methyl ester carboxylesterase